ncbi:MAG: hypothetical protein JRH20_19655 [Deltaproteobacteria bacterium]|nr:hypothetical protein [Deltaproteobacteria bacterium]
MQMDAATGDVQWVPGESQGGTHHVVLRASNDAGVFADQSYQLGVAVPRSVASAEIGAEGGEISAEGITIRFPADAIASPATFTLSVLEQATPPLWDEMHLLGLPFIVQSDSELTTISAIAAYDVELAGGRTGFLAHEAPSAHLAAAAVESVVVVDPTSSGITPGEIQSDLRNKRSHLVLDNWYAWSDTTVTITSDDGIHVLWVHKSTPEPSISTISTRILNNLKSARATANGSMGCDTPEELRVYVATFFDDNLAGTEVNETVYINKRVTDDPVLERAVANHEYMHAIQDRMLGADRVVTWWSWWTEPTAEHGAEELFNSNISHQTFGALDNSLTQYGLTARFDGAPSEIYKLYIYFRFLHETTSWRVCDFFRSQSAKLHDDQFNEAMNSFVGPQNYSESFRDFTEAYTFFREPAYFGDDAPGIGSWEPKGFDFEEGEKKHFAIIHGGVGIKVNRLASEPQTLLVSLSGSLVTQGTALGTIRAANNDILGHFSSDTKEVLLEDISSPTLYITATQGNMSLHSQAQRVNISVREVTIIVENKSSATTSEDGDSMTFDVRLAADPGATPISVDVRSADSTEGTPDVTSLSFNGDTWDVPQTVTITGKPDDEVDGDVGYGVELSITEPMEWEATETVDLINLDGAVVQYSMHPSYIGDRGGSTMRDTEILETSNVPITIRREAFYTGTTCQASPTDTVGMAKTTVTWEPVTFTASGTVQVKEHVIPWNSVYDITESVGTSHTWRHLSEDHLAGSQPDCAPLPAWERGSPFTTHSQITAALPGIGPLVVRDVWVDWPKAPGINENFKFLDLATYTSPGNYQLTWKEKWADTKADGQQFRWIDKTRVQTFVNGVSSETVTSVASNYYNTVENPAAGNANIGDGDSTTEMQADADDSRHAPYMYFK